MAAHSIPSHAHNAVDLSAVLANTSTKLRNESLLSALVHKTHQLPAMFVEAEDQRPMLEMDGPTLATSASIPIVDMSVLSSSDPAQRASLVANIAEACEKFGFFQVVNHGVDESLIHRCEMEAHKMFELPLDVKERVHRPPGTSFGYGANTWINQTVMHWAESFHMQLHPQSNIKEFSGKLFAESDPTRFRFALWSIRCKVAKMFSRMGLCSLIHRLHNWSCAVPQLRSTWDKSRHWRGSYWSFSRKD